MVNLNVSDAFDETTHALRMQPETPSRPLASAGSAVAGYRANGFLVTVVDVLYARSL